MRSSGVVRPCRRESGARRVAECRSPAIGRGLLHALCAAATVAAAACAERPTGVARGHQGPPVAEPLRSVRAPSYCTKTWVGSTDGDWGDSTRWNPAGMPAASDTACILAPSAYTVTMRAHYGPYQIPPYVGALHLGDGRSPVSLHLIDTTYHHARVYSWVSVRQGSRLVFGGPEQLFRVDSIDNRGVIEVMDQGGATTTFEARAVVNSGTLLLRGRTTFARTTFPGEFLNLGDIEVSHPQVTVRMMDGSPWAPKRFVHAGGVIRGSHPLRLDRVAFFGLSRATLEWSGGRIEAIPGSGGPSAVRATDFALALDRTPPGSGQVDLRGTPGVLLLVTGDVPPGVGVSLGGDSATFLMGAIGAPAPVNRGTLTLEGASNTFSVSHLENLHRLELVDAVSLSVDSLVNRGTIDLSAPLVLTRASARLLNAGTIVASSSDGAVTMPPTTVFIAAPAGRMSAPLILDNATLTGDGSVGDVTSLGGRLRPGLRSGRSARRRSRSMAARTCWSTSPVSRRRSTIASPSRATSRLTAS